MCERCERRKLEMTPEQREKFEEAKVIYDNAVKVARERIKATITQLFDELGDATAPAVLDVLADDMGELLTHAPGQLMEATVMTMLNNIIASANHHMPEGKPKINLHHVSNRGDVNFGDRLIEDERDPPKDVKPVIH